MRVSLMTTTVRPAVRWSVEHALPRQVLRMSEKRGDIQARLVAESRHVATPDLAGLFDEIRGRGRLVRTDLAYLTATHEVCREVLSSPDVKAGFPAPDNPAIARILDWTKTETLHPVQPPSLLAVDGPDHTRYRKLVTKVFTVKAVEALRGRVEEIAAGLLDEIAASGADQVELVEAYCSRLPVAMITEILGVPPQDQDLVRGFGSAAAPSLDMGLSWKMFRSVDNGLTEFDTWLDQHLENLRRNPGDNLMSKLAATRDEEGGLNLVELKATAGLVLAAGFETTVNLLSNAIALLHDHPEQRELLKAEPERWSNAVDEVLRFDPPVLLTGRKVDKATTIAGVDLRPGVVVTTVLAGANRDPEVFTDPNTFDVTRENAKDHMAFSAGRHYCLGASLARLEGEVALRALYERFPDLQVLPGAQRRKTRVLRGFQVLPATV
ncbi:hypothetical protein FB554_2892 [Barrientosiimonas humi]|uniref:Cytochrome P450 n=2 Tax=Barrientosiimonas humi TaxID=999931 RepID=A0A542XFZ0_9MICO|nr:hypothetical protein FB554_2892 [Barrientosiimonas humi]CAG7574705.1 Putative cytochrome P450 140 [Barrientosiimonas humi]